MNTATILVVDNDPKNLQILKESLEKANFSVTTVNNGIDAFGIIQSQRPDLVVCEVDIPGLDGFALQEKLHGDPTVAAIPIVFLTNQRNLENRIKGLRSGVKDYMIKPLHVKEVIARLKMILKRLERIRNEGAETNRNIVGRLEEKSVEDLVENYGQERCTGVLSVYDHNNLNGEIYFRDGTVVNARLGNFKAEKAVYQMLPWKRGHFVMTFKDVNVKDEITVSNLGLLLQGFKRMQQREELIKQLPSLQTVFVKTAIFEQILKKKRISADAEKFIALFDGRRAISNVLAESNYDDIKALEKITKLYQQGFIRPLEIGVAEKTPPEPFDTAAFERDSTSFPGPKEPPFQERPTPPHPNEHSVQIPEAKIDQKIEVQIPQQGKVHREISEVAFEPEEKIQEKPFHFKPVGPPVAEPAAVNGRPKPDERSVEKTETDELLAVCNDLFNKRSGVTGQLAIIGSDNEARKAMIATLTSRQVAAKSSNERAIEIGKISTANNCTLEVIGLSTESKFLEMLHQMAETLIGYVVLIRGDNTANLGYAGYLINSLKQRLDAPHVVAVYQTTKNRSIPLDVVRYSLRMDESEQLVQIEVEDSHSVKHLLKQLKRPDYDVEKS